MLPISINSIMPKVLALPVPVTTAMSHVERLKSDGASHFKVKEWEAAAKSYAAAAEQAEEVGRWPQLELVAAACRSNAALCFLKLDQPVRASWDVVGRIVAHFRP
jgi:hypothetical protein